MSKTKEQTCKKKGKSKISFRQKLSEHEDNLITFFTTSFCCGILWCGAIQNEMTFDIFPLQKIGDTTI